VQGELLADRYRLVDLLGNGGMGTVWEAWDVVLERAVAVKFLAGAGTEAGRRLEHEARATARVTDPRIAALYDVSRSTDGRSFLVMELVRGSGLADLLREQGTLQPEFVAAIGAQVAQALAVAHDRGVVHHDIKPANLLITPDGQVKVIDFGIATVGGPACADGGSVLGTAAYAAPELALGQPTHAAADLYALGCVLYQALSGQPPFNGESVPSLLYQHVHVPPRPLDSAVPERLQAIVLGLLAKDPADRPEAHQAAEELTASARPIPPRPSVVPLSTAGSTQDAAVSTMQWSVDGAKRRRGARRLGLAVAALAVPAAAIATVTLSMVSEEDPAAALLPTGTPSTRPTSPPTTPAVKPTTVPSVTPARATRTVTATAKPSTAKSTRSFGGLSAQVSGIRPGLPPGAARKPARLDRGHAADRSDKAADRSARAREHSGKDQNASNADRDK
jgi:eukaryotic-like serine/threonine-protein kinase